MNNATRTCSKNGTWLNNWTNYTQCYDDGLTQMPCDLPTVNQTKLIEVSNGNIKLHIFVKIKMLYSSITFQ